MKLHFLHWLEGWAHLLDAIVIILTLGFYDPGLTSTVYEHVLMELFGIDFHRPKGY